MQSSFIKAETYPVSGFLKTGRGCVVISSDVITDVYLLLIAHNRIFTKNYYYSSRAYYYCHHHHHHHHYNIPIFNLKPVFVKWISLSSIIFAIVYLRKYFSSVSYPKLTESQTYLDNRSFNADVIASKDCVIPIRIPNLNRLWFCKHVLCPGSRILSFKT